MRPDGVVVVSPDGELSPSVSEAREYFLVQHLVAQAAIEALDERVLRRFAWGDILPGHAGLALPFEDGPTGQLGAVVADHLHRFAVEADQAVELAGDAPARE